MTRLASSLCMAFSLLLCVAPPVLAQDVGNEPPAHISFVDGVVVLEREGRTETAPRSMPVLAGDRLKTENGRVEVLFVDGSTLHLDTSSVVDFQSDEVIRLIDGRIRLTIAGPPRGVNYRIDAPGGWAEISQPGEYRLSLLRNGREPELELAVLRGSAELVNEDGRTALRAGERAFARPGEAPSYAYVYNSAAWDDFDRWSENRRDARLGVSGQYLPESVRPYAATFDQYGSWNYDMSYGYVWYPTVAIGWRPYYYGRWSRFSFGWTWIGTDAWAWPTHHYGRWGYSAAGAWFWIPGRQWGPAWVSWAYAPGYVSWCPLGWDNRPAVQFVSVNVHGGHHYDPWHAWTVVPRQRFGSGFVQASVVAGARIDPRTRSSFVAGQTAPASRGYAVPRSAAPIYAVGARRSPGAGGTIPSFDSGVGGGSRNTREVSGDQTSRTRQAQDAAATLRNRSQSGSMSSGSGFPAPARTPRDSSVLTNRGSGSDGLPGRRTAVPRQDASQSDRSAVSRNRSDGRVESGEAAAPSRRLEMPGYRRSPAPSQLSPDRSGDRIAPSVPTPDRGMAAPRRYEGYPGGAATIPDPRIISPARPYEPPADRGYRRAYPEGGALAVPRSAPAEAPRQAAPPPSNRSNPGAEGRGPGSSGPPPSAGQGRATEGQPANAGGQQRSSGGQSSGMAVRRGGGRGGR